MFIKRMILIFTIQSAFELFGLYRPGCQFQNSIIPVSLVFALVAGKYAANWRLLGYIGAGLGIGVMLFQNYFLSGSADELAMVSTFTRMSVILIGLGLCVVIGRILNRHTLRIFPWCALTFCVVVFTYAVVRANTKVQGDVVTGEFDTLFERFEAKLVGDRGAVWLDALKTELFRKPLIFKRQADLLVKDRAKNALVVKMAPHNQVLTLLCRYGWWQGLFMVMFLWWMHLREFRAASKFSNDRVMLCTLLAPSAAIFIAVGLTGQHVFTQMWYASSMASLTFPGILYGAVRERERSRMGFAWR